MSLYVSVSIFIYIYLCVTCVCRWRDMRIWQIGISLSIYVYIYNFHVYKCVWRGRICVYRYLSLYISLSLYLSIYIYAYTYTDIYRVYISIQYVPIASASPRPVHRVQFYRTSHIAARHVGYHGLPRCLALHVSLPECGDAVGSRSHRRRGERKGQGRNEVASPHFCLPVNEKGNA